MKKSLFVSGYYDDANGRKSRIANTIFNYSDLGNCTYINGGNFSDLTEVAKELGDYDIIFWMADIPNDKPKIVKNIKDINQECVLVTSKRNHENGYSFHELLQRALSNKSNLCIEFSGNSDKYYGRVFDPLGNVFLDYCDDFGKVGHISGKRATELSGFTRLRSKSTGKGIQVPENEEFFDIVRGYSSVFHDLIHGCSCNTERYLGNASFRCENGFPSFRDGSMIFVSKRNMDKREIDSNSFVATQPNLPVRYFGDVKPSVDTPIQLKLYDYYGNVSHMIHSHTYVEESPFTPNIIPCGAMEEFDEITSLFPNRGDFDFCVNLRGHGSIALAKNIDFLKDIRYYARKIPEMHNYE